MKWGNNGNSSNGNGNSSGSFENPKPGAHVARLYGMADLGTQDDNYQGQATRRRKVILWWELAAKMKDGRQFSIFKEYTQSLAEKATLRKHLEGWAGKKLTDEQVKTFDPKVLLGKPFLLTLVQNATGKMKVDGMVAVPDGMEKPPLANPKRYFSLDEFDQTAFDALPDWVKAKVVLSPEFEAATKGHGEEEAPKEGAGIDPDDIPF